MSETRQLAKADKKKMIMYITVIALCAALAIFTTFLVLSDVSVETEDNSQDDGGTDDEGDESDGGG